MNLKQIETQLLRSKGKLLYSELPMSGYKKLQKRSSYTEVMNIRRLRLYLQKTMMWHHRSAPHGLVGWDPSSANSVTWHHTVLTRAINRQEPTPYLPTIDMTHLYPCCGLPLFGAYKQPSSFHLFWTQISHIPLQFRFSLVFGILGSFILARF